MRASALLIVALVGGCAGSAVETRAPELAVTRAVLYQNGIGYFERRGRVDDNVLHLRVRPDQIRDFLKSLTIVDTREGHAVSIALPIEKSRAKQMSDLPEQVRTQGGVLAIAQAFRGARCRIVADQTVTGRLVGVEDLGGEGEHDWRLSVLSDGGSLVQLRVDKVKQLKVLDGTLEIGLRKALDVALDSGQWKPVDVAVRLSGHGPHDLVVSYVVEMPTWKPAYRLVLGKAGDKALLQGWAVVDNVSGDDWKGIKLSLTAGMPLAFTYDLYTPRYPQRPNLAPVDQLAAISPDSFNAVGGMAAEPSPPPPPASASAPSPSPVMPSSPSRSSANKKSKKESYDRDEDGSALEQERQSAVSPEILERNFRSLVAGTRVGSLFRYDLAEPVTVDERQSALVNIINARVKGEEVLLFRVGSDSESPFRAVRFDNDSGFVLEAGPIAIYHNDGDSGTFVGEALGARIEKGASTFVPYALDGRVHVQLDEHQHEEGMTLVKLIRGVLTVDTKMITRYSYDVDNGSGEATTLFVRRERRPGWKLSNVENVIEENGAYYLPIKLPEKGRTHVVVEESTPVQRSVDIWNSMGRQAIALYIKDAHSNGKVVAQLKEATELQQQSGSLDDQISNLEQQRNTLGQRQKEVRDNIFVLGKSSKNGDLKHTLETSLAELETQLNDVTRKLVQLSIARGNIRDRLAILMKTITIE